MSNATSMQTEFFVTKGDEQLGPWTIAEVAEKLAASEIAVTDFIYLDEKSDWVPLLECAALKERLNQAKPKKAPPPKRVATAPTQSEEMTDILAIATKSEMSGDVVPVSAAKESAPVLAAVQTETLQPAKPEGARAMNQEWFVQKGAHRYGPFTYLGLVKALQEKSVYDFDFVWKEGMDNWVRIAEHEEFQADKIRLLRSQANQEGEVFLSRQHKRIPFESEVIVHDDRSVWMGVATEASVGGSGLVIENATLVPGQVIRLHFASTDQLPAFNALGEIVGKRYSQDVRAANSPVKYAVRFLKIDGTVEPQVREYFGAGKTTQKMAM